MKLKVLILLIFAVGLVLPVLAEEVTTVSITEDETQFRSVPSDKNIIYSYETTMPHDGILVLSVGYNDTYMVQTTDTIRFVTVEHKEVQEINIIDALFWWL